MTGRIVRAAATAAFLSATAAGAAMAQPAEAVAGSGRSGLFVPTLPVKSALKAQKAKQIAATQRATKLARQSAAVARQRENARVARERQAARWPEVTEPFTRTLRLASDATFDLRNAAGDIVITGARGDQLRIEAVKRVRHRVEAQARAALGNARIEIVERAGSVEVRTVSPPTRAVSIAVDYVVAVPGDANVTVETASGDVRVSNVQGEVRIRAGGGSVTATNLRRLRGVRTVGGNVEIIDAEADEFSGETLRGGITIRNLRARVLDLRTLTGDVRLTDVTARRVRLESMSGDLDYDGTFVASGRYDFQTHSGSVRIHPLGDIGFDLDASSVAGDVRSDYELNAVSAARGRRAGQSLRGTTGNAEAVVNARSFGGDVIIRRR